MYINIYACKLTPFSPITFNKFNLKTKTFNYFLLRFSEFENGYSSLSSTRVNRRACGWGTNDRRLIPLPFQVG